MNSSKVSAITVLLLSLSISTLFAQGYNELRENAMLLALEKAKRNINPLVQDYGLTKNQSRENVMATALREAERKAKESLLKNTDKPDAINVRKESLAPPIQKGAWTLEKGEIYTEIYTKYYWHNRRFDNEGKNKKWDYGGKYNELRTELKLEYGLTERHTIMLYTVAKEAHWKDIFASYTRRGFVEMWPGIKYLLFQEPFVCSLQTRAKFPFDYSERTTPALGRHQIDGELKILTAQPWPKLPGYTKFELGFRGRNEEPANEIPYFFEFGYNLAPKFIIKTTLDGNEGINRTGQIDEDWIKYTFGPIFKIGDLFNMELGYGNTFAGKNTSAAKEVYFSLSRQW